jgi:ABC-2 type transport system ATP-binding protein
LIVNGGRLVVDAALADLRQSRELELVTDLEPAAARKALDVVAAMSALHPENIAAGEWRRYRIELAAGGDPRAVAAAVANAVIAAHGRLASLQPVVRNLETLFREVSERTEVTRHAA